MNILEEIIAQKRIEVQQKKLLVPEELLLTAKDFTRKCRSLKEALSSTRSSGIIAEFKRKSPSKGWLKEHASVGQIVKDYHNAGAAGISILTDEIFFGGTLDDLKAGRETIEIPILRKDFIMDEYQLVESKACGADVILLIAAYLTPGRVNELAVKARDLGLEIILEIHHEGELSHICDEVDIVGINNRDLTTFIVDIARSAELAVKVPAGKLMISESGINSDSEVLYLRNYGFSGFLVGEKFMREDNPGKACEDFIDLIKKRNEN